MATALWSEPTSTAGTHLHSPLYVRIPARKQTITVDLGRGVFSFEVRGPSESTRATPAQRISVIEGKDTSAPRKSQRVRLQEFRHLTKQWRDETGFLSSLPDKVIH